MTAGALRSGAPPPTAPAKRGRNVWLAVGGVLVAVLVLLGVAGLVITRFVWRVGLPVLGTSRPSTFALAGSALAVIHEDDGGRTLATVNLDNGEQTELVTKVGDPTAVALDADWVLYATCHAPGSRPCAGATFAVPRASGDPRKILDAPATELVLAGGKAYAIADDRLYVGAVGADLLADPTPVVRGRAHAIAANAASLFVLGEAELVSADLGGWATHSLGPGCKNGGLLAADASAVYVACTRAAPDDEDTVERVPVDGAPRDRFGVVHHVSAMATSERGLVLAYDVPQADDHSTSSSMLGLWQKPGGPIRVLVERSGWGPLAVRDRDVYLLGWEYVFRTSLP